jgi:hypothetical protein
VSAAGRWCINRKGARECCRYGGYPIPAYPKTPPSSFCSQLAIPEPSMTNELAAVLAEFAGR